MQIPKHSPRFSGFYEVKAGESKLDQLPIGKANGVPYLTYLSPNAPDYTWMFVFPESDKKLETILNKDKIEFTHTSEKEVVQKFTRPGETPLAITNRTDNINDAPVIGQLLSRFASNRISTLMNSAIKSAFESAFGPSDSNS
ncbi:MAG: hypothetical protein K2X66_02615 [Cyanobacteria bacterium]|nr:hypothetical protein [Cyanobacteriota bacterium]